MRCTLRASGRVHLVCSLGWMFPPYVDRLGAGGNAGYWLAVRYVTGRGARSTPDGGPGKWITSADQSGWVLSERVLHEIEGIARTRAAAYDHGRASEALPGGVAPRGDRDRRAPRLAGRARGGAPSLLIPPGQQTLDRRRIERRAELVDELCRSGGQERVDLVA